MRVAILSVLAAAVTMGAFAIPAAASYDYPYCVQGRGVGYPGDCSYRSYAQCQASASGRNVSCGINPRVAFQVQRPQERGYGPRSRGEGGFYGRY